MMENKKIYNTKNTVKEYNKLRKLFPPEETILTIIKSDSSKLKMIDIGVGVGRTTLYFAPLFQEYIGIDYANVMIEKCLERFKNYSNAKFYHRDARDMNIFQNNTFDFIFFSFNGIDCVSIDDRIKIFKEIRRIGKKHAVFVFSSHNLFNCNKLFSFIYPRNPLKYFKEYRRYKGVNKFNPSLDHIVSQNFAIIKDGDMNFSVEYVYINPCYQINQLYELGFTDIKIFSQNTGKEIMQNTDWKSVNDPWLYYFCINSK